eukprot:2526676-Ditylum_brightwellii.AAC.1
MSEMAQINTHSQDKDCSALTMLADLSPEAVSNPRACGKLSDPCVSDQCTGPPAYVDPHLTAFAQPVPVTTMPCMEINNTPCVPPSALHTNTDPF